MKEWLAKVISRGAGTWPWRWVASRMLILKAMNRDQEALNAAVAAMRAATAATDAATAAVNAAAAATAALNLSSAATAAASEPIHKWHAGYSWEGAEPACPNRFKRYGKGVRSWFSIRR